MRLIIAEMPGQGAPGAAHAFVSSSPVERVRGISLIRYHWSTDEPSSAAGRIRRLRFPLKHLIE